MYYSTILICVCSNSVPFPTSEKTRIRNRICVISALLRIRQKNMNVDVKMVLSDPFSSLLMCLYGLSFSNHTNEVLYTVKVAEDPLEVLKLENYQT
jgi:hypothetical protein